MKYLKKSFTSMQPYISKKMKDGIILNANEAPYLPPKEVLECFKKEILDLDYNRYPDMEAIELRSAIASHFHLDTSEVTCGVGSDELLEVTFKAVLEENDVVLSFSPSFSMYKVFADLTLANFQEIFFKEDYSFSIEEMINAIKKYNPKLILICNPNNPTGSFIEKKDIIRIIEATKALVLLDFAYIDFAKEDYSFLAKEYTNVIVFRTFSKAMALPSIRVGYAISCKENIDMINAVKAPYSVTSISQILARIAIEHYDLYKIKIDNVILERQRVYEALKNYFTIYPSQANFLFIKLSDDINNELIKNHIYIRKMKKNMYRITIGNQEENNQLIKVVMKYA